MAQTGVNRVILVGNIGQDPEVRYLPNGSPVANFSLATSEVWKDKQTETLKEQTEWHRLCCYRKLAEFAGNYLKKGAKIYVEGRLRYRKWKDNAGIERFTSEIQVDELRLLDSRRTQNELDHTAGAPSGRSPEAHGSQPSKPEGAATDHGAVGNFMGEEGLDFDEDIPF